MSEFSVMISDNGKGFFIHRAQRYKAREDGTYCNEALAGGEWHLGVADYFETYDQALKEAQKHGYLLASKSWIDIKEAARIADPKDFGWIKVKRHVDDPNANLEERLAVLQEHHVKETTFLLEKCRTLAELLLISHARG